MRQVIGPDADAVVRHLDNQLIILNMRRDVDLAIVFTVVDGVLDEVAHNGVEVMRDEVGLGLLLVRGIGEFNLPVDTRLAVTLDDHAQVAHHVARTPVRPLEGTAHATHLQNAVHQQQQVVALTLDDLHILALTGRGSVVLRCRLGNDAVGGAHDGRQGGAQLVHHVGKEQRARLFDLSHQPLGAQANACRVKQSRYNGSRHDNEQYGEQSHQVARAVQALDVLVQDVHLALLDIGLIFSNLMTHFVALFKAVNAVIHLAALEVVVQGPLHIALLHRQVEVHVVHFGLLLHAVDVQGLGLGFLQITPCLIGLAHFDIHVHKRQTGIQPVIGVALLLELVIGLLEFGLGMRVIAIIGIKLPKIQMALRLAGFTAQQPVVPQRLVVVQPGRIGVAKGTLEVSQAGTVDCYAPMTVQRPSSPERLMEQAVGLGIMTQFQLDVTDSVERHEPLIDTLLAILLTKGRLDLQHLVIETVGFAQVTLVPVI